MTKESDFALVAGSNIVHKGKVTYSAFRFLYSINRVPAGLFRRLFGLLFVLSLSNLACAQTLVIDINVVGLNVNQSKASVQLGQACESLNGNTSEQAIALQAVCGLIDSLDVNTPEGVRRLQEIADAVAPEEAFALNDSLLAISDYQTTNVHARLNALRNPELINRIKQQSQQVPEFSNSLLSAPEPQVGGGASADLVSSLGGFINGHVSSGEVNGGVLQQDSDIASSSLTFGGDYRIGSSVIAGFGVGFAQDETKFSRVFGGAVSDGFNFTAYATWFETDEGYLDIVLDLGRTDYELERSVSIIPESVLIATSSPTSQSTSLTVSGGRNFQPFGFDLGGYFRLSFAGATIDSYSESLKVQRPGFAPLFSVSDQSIVSTKMVVGLNLSKAVSTSRAVLLPLLRIEYVKENDRKKEALNTTLIATGTTAQYQGEDRATGYSNLGIGASAVFSGGKSVYAFYETHLEHDLVSQDWLKAGIRLEF